jgi:hypothetical protein
MSFSFLFYSHTDYKDLWNIIKKTPIPSFYTKYIALNTNEIINGFETIQYNDSLSYSEKVISILEKIQTKYIVFIHDVDLLLSFNQNNFENIIQNMEENNIDRLMFGVIAKEGFSIQTNEYNIGKINNLSTPHFFIPYDVSPSIWKVSSLLYCMNCVKGVGYRDIETSKIKEICKNEMNIWGFFSHNTNKSYYVIGRPFPGQFQFLHIFAQGKIFESKYYMDQEENFKKLLIENPELCKRGILINQDHIRLDFKTV